MLRNYLKIAFRNLVKNPGYSAINIGGLALGMAVAMLIGLWIYDEISFNKNHKNYDRIVQVMEQQTLDSETQTGQNVAIPVGKELETYYGDHFKHVVMSSWTVRHLLTYGDNKLTRMGNFMSATTPEMLSLNMVKGSWSALNDPASVLLSKSVAKALFGSAEPLGKMIKIDSELDVRVTGVYEDIPHSSDFRDVHFIAPWDLYVSTTDWVRNARDNNEWAGSSFQIFAQLSEKADLATVSAKIKNIKIDKGDKEELKFKPQILLHPMSRWHLYSEWQNGVNTGGKIQTVWFFSIIGVFVLLLACINFMNLSTARSEKRSREVGIRKAIGSVRLQLAIQFLSESYLIVISAFLLAILLAQLALPLFNEIADKEMVLMWTSPWFWVISICFCLLTGLVAGSYPALYLSSFDPAKALRGLLPSRVLGGFVNVAPRKILVVLQFTVSVTLIIGTIVIYRQIKHGQNRAVGYDREGLVSIHVSTPEIHKHIDAFRDELIKTGTVSAVSESMGPTTDVRSVNKGFNWKGKDPAMQVDFVTMAVAHDFGKTVGWKFVEGRDFSKSFSTDSSGFVLNETAARLMGFSGKAPGEFVKWEDKSFKVIGVVKDMIMTSPYEPVKQTIFFIGRRAGNFITIRIDPKANAADALRNIESVFKKHDPASPFQYDFVDDEYAFKFADEQRIGTLAAFFAVLAILISSLGLFGLASFVAGQRIKEIGIRKVLGASVANLWLLLSGDFVLLVAIACLLSAPTSWYYMSSWLEKYTYRTEISWWIFAASATGALTLTLLTVSYQAIRAALLDPVKSLRSE
ncbi:ABC transporter permease [Dyadobacter pollutisoli]|uniref:ABC transporter permease n=1 Tax=Dyadobacter pollutisoli TaxID=2910158 RepID=A0A9E8SNB5_9BACT|nr:ABC transporter permease [Dyadobacter pollutisoli]WAC10607.1 ABC transporter permease [Dyadobacter pollutisoli]